MNETTRVALYALVYREVFRTGHESSEGLLEDIDVCPGEISLATLLGSSYLSDDDWALLNQLGHRDDFSRSRGGLCITIPSGPKC